VLDSSRFAYFIASELKVSVNAVNTMVMGSHGDFMVPLPRYTSVDGMPLAERLPMAKIERLVERTRNAGAEIIKLEKDSSAFYAPASSLVLMIESILLDKKTVLPCSVYLNGEYRINGVFLGVPVVLGADGIEKIIQLKLNKKEMSELAVAASKIKELVSHLKE
jgi:malate dehydrogenase